MLHTKHQEIDYQCPARSGKTTLVSIAFPVWVWLQNAQEKFIFASCDKSLSMEHSIKSRRLIESDWFQRRWGHKFKLTKDQNTKTKYDNDKGGYRISTSVESKIIGRGGSILICDDPNVENALQCANTNIWYAQEFSTRLNDPKQDVQIIIQQRIAEKDLTGYLIANDEAGLWTKLILLQEFESLRRSQTYDGDKVVWQDPRTKDGELLFPARFGKQEVDNFKVILGSYGFANKHQQRPAPLEGGILQKSWFKVWDKPNYPNFEVVLQSWDTAFSDKPDAAYSACTTWGVFYEDDKDTAGVMLLSCWRGRVGFPELRDRAKRLYKNHYDIETEKTLRRDHFSIDKCLIEAKATGDPLIRDLRLAGIPAVGYLPKGDKTSRVQRVSAYIEAGSVYVVGDPHNKDKLLKEHQEFLDIIALFPNSDSRDYVDTMTQALEYLRDNNMLVNKHDELINKPFKKRKDLLYFKK